MQTPNANRRNVRLVPLVIFLLLYLVLSIAAGFPLGFGKLLARGVARDYCEAVYPQAALGKTVYNPVDSAFSTLVSVGEDTFTIDTNPMQDAVGDDSRTEAFLQDTGATEVISRLWRTYVSGAAPHRLIGCYVTWSRADPATPTVSLHIAYADDGHASLPDEAQLKALLAPIALDCVTALEVCVPLDDLRLSYYHPAFDPDEKGMTWQIMDVPLDDGRPRTSGLLDAAPVRIG